MNDEQLLLSAVRQMTGQSPPARNGTAEMMNEALLWALQRAKAAYEYAQQVVAERDAVVAQRDALRKALERVAAEGATRDATADLEHVQNIAREALAGLEEA